MTETAGFTGASATSTAISTANAAAAITSKTHPQHPTSHSGDAPTLSLNSHRQRSIPSRLPAPRLNDANKKGALPVSSHQSQQSPPSQPHPYPQPHRQRLQLASPSTVSPNPASAPSAHVQEQPRAPSTTSHHPQDSSTSDSTESSPRSAARSRASHSNSNSNSSSISTRSNSNPDATAEDQLSPSSKPATARSSRRAPASYSAYGVATTVGPPLTLVTQRLRTAGAVAQASHTSTPEKQTTEWGHGQRELLLPKALSQSSQANSPDDHRSSVLLRSVSYKTPSIPQSGTTTPVRVPPIRGFRSSGSRKSLAIDMNFKSRPYETSPDYADGTDDHTLRRLEGRYTQDALHMARPSSRRQEHPEADDAGDVFLRIARENSPRRERDENIPDDAQSGVAPSRTIRPFHRRPLSTVVPTYHHSSPPRASRRLSDQQDRPRPKFDEDQLSEISRTSTYRSMAREKAASAHPGEDLGYGRSGNSPLRPSPLVSRSPAPQEPSSDSPVYPRRRASVADGSSSSHGRTSTYRAGHGYSKTYSPSPLVRSFDLQSQRGSEAAHGLEGTESTASTTAPSTVWDELDDLKSRINRLELTGKLPSTSGAAVSRLSDERPATATTTVTTASLSPKRPGVVGAAETPSITSFQREAHPILHSALSRSRPFLNTDVYRALESAANDAIGLSSMMGGVGQPGPISSGASTIGSVNTVTDRQLRRKADSVCRSLTELCVALSDDATHAPVSQSATVNAPTRSESPAVSTVSKAFSSLPPQRRPSVVAEQGPPASSSPRAMSKFEERRNNLLNGSSLPSPRVAASTPTTPTEANMNRRSSLLVSRTRRAGTEEPEDGRMSAMLRSRRAGTEEPEEGRRTSLLVRNRRGTADDDNDDTRFRSPSRANTDINAAKDSLRDYLSETRSQAPDTASQVSSSAPRRRFVSSNLQASRLATPGGSAIVPPRKYLEKATPEREINPDRAARHKSFSQPIPHSRTGSLGSWRQNRDSMGNAGAAAAK